MDGVLPARVVSPRTFAPAFVCMATGSVPAPFWAAHLIPGVRRIHSLLVAASFQEDTDGIQLEKHLAGHRVKEGDVGKGRRRQQEDFPRRRLLAQFWMVKRKTSASLPMLPYLVCHSAPAIALGESLGRCFNAHFTDEESGCQRGRFICLYKWQSWDLNPDV